MNKNSLNLIKRSTFGLISIKGAIDNVAEGIIFPEILCRYQPNIITQMTMNHLMINDIIT